MAQPATAGSAINRDLGHKLSHVVSIASIVGNDTTEGTGAGVDLKGYEGAQVVFNMGISGDTLSGSVLVTLSVEDSPDNVTYTALDAAQYRLDAGAALVIDSATEDPVLVALTILPGVGVNRYIRAKVAFTGTHTNGMPISAHVVRGFARKEPAGV